MKIFALSVLLFGALSFAQSQNAFASCGTFEVSKGDVKVQSADGKIAAAPVGSKICSGDTVIAADQARAKIHMEDGNELNISPNSKIVIEAYQYDVASNKKKVLLNVLKGKVRATTAHENMYNDKSKDGQANTFQVRTKSAVAGVRGTDFLTGFDPKTNKMDVVTFRGKVEVGLAGPAGQIMNPVQVVVGQQTSVSLGQPPALPRAVSPAELTKMNVESHNEAPPAAPNAPAADTSKKQDQGSKDGANNGSTGAANGPAAGGTTAASTDASGGSPNRTPASSTTSSGSMISSSDLASSPNQTAMPTMKMPGSSAMTNLTNLAGPTSAVSDFVNNQVQQKNLNSNVTVRLKTN